VPANHGVGYGGEYVTSEKMPVGIIPIGYADGFRRYPKAVNSVLFQDKLIPTIGRICMDYCMLDLRQAPTACVGDEVVLMGKGLSADDLATRWGTNNYDVVVNIGNRVARRYV
jgi:alanine racemase